MACSLLKLDGSWQATPSITKFLNISSFKQKFVCFSRLLMTTWCFPEPMEKSLHGLTKTENPDFFGHFRRFLSTFRKCRPSYVKQEMFFQGAKQITPNEGITYILLPRTTHKKEFSQYTDSWRKRRFFSIIFISVLCDNTWGHTYFVETRKIVQIKIKSYEHDNPILPKY